MKSTLSTGLRSLLVLCLFQGLLLADSQVGQPAPSFTLQGIDGKNHTLAEYAGKYVVLEWTNPNCPFVHKHYDSGNMQKLQKDLEAKGVVWLSVCSSGPGKDGNYPPTQVQKILNERQATPPASVSDATGVVGKSYGARSTPDMFVIDPKGVLIYSGAIDSISSGDPADIPKATNYVRQAIDESMAGKPVSVPTTRSYGCGVHY